MSKHAASFRDLIVYVTCEEADRMNDGLAQIGRMLNSMTEKSASFCGDVSSVVKEDSAEYFTP